MDPHLVGDIVFEAASILGSAKVKIVPGEKVKVTGTVPLGRPLGALRRRITAADREP
ncbi:MAG: hypothetical protein ABIK09_21210 [Pseudomonadota bacterium]